MKSTLFAAGATTLGGCMGSSQDRQDLGSSLFENQPFPIVASMSMLSPLLDEHRVVTNLHQMQQSGVSCVFTTVTTNENWGDAIEQILLFEPFLEKLGVQPCRSVAEIQSARAAGKTAVIYHCGDSYLLGSPFVSRTTREDMITTFEIGRIRSLHELGVRIMQVSSDFKGYLGDGCTELTDLGLTNYGQWAVRTMNEVGMLIDCSHASWHTSMETIALSKAPVIFSSANSWSLCKNNRNVTDEQIQAIAKNGGVIGVSAQSVMVDEKRPTIDRLIDHIDHMVKLSSPDHIALGLSVADDDVYWRLQLNPEVYPPPPWPYVIKDPRQIPLIVSALRKRGYDETAIRKITSENFLRVFRQVWKA